MVFIYNLCYEVQYFKVVYIMNFKSLKEKCEYYRSLPDYRLMPNMNMLVMLDGKNFSTLVKNNFELPFDDKFIDMINETALTLCKKVQGVKFAYTQSDEISLLITDYDTNETETLFNGRLCKIQSILASMATSEFNRHFIPYQAYEKAVVNDPLYNIANMKMAMFDCKAWVVPNLNDVYAWFLYRQYDCIRNSKQQAAQTYLSHKELMNLDTDQQVKLLKSLHGIDWNEYPDGCKFGRFCYKESQQFKKVLESGEEVEFERKKFVCNPAFELKDNYYEFVKKCNLYTE